MRSGVTGSTRLRDCASQQLRQLGDIGCDPPRIVFGEQLRLNVRFAPESGD
jgi:hypothetical protein